MLWGYYQVLTIKKGGLLQPPFSFYYLPSTTACAAASLACGILNGEQET